MEVLAGTGRLKQLIGALETELRQAFLDNKHQLYYIVAQGLNIPVLVSTTRAIAKSLSPTHLYRIVKRKRPYKHITTIDDAARKRAYSQWLKSMLQKKVGYTGPRKVIFVISDETPTHIGGPLMHEEFVTIREGALAHKLSKMVDTHENFTL